MKSKLRKTGNSYAFTFPIFLMEMYGIKEGDILDIPWHKVLKMMGYKPVELEEIDEEVFG